MISLSSHTYLRTRFDFGAGGVSRSAAEERKRSFANAATQPRMIPLPTHKDGNGEAEELRNRRYLGKRFGGTVVCTISRRANGSTRRHWRYADAAVSGRTVPWGLGSEWRMYGSPLVRHEDGYISGGRSQPRPDMEVAYLQQARRQAQANAAHAQAQAARMGSFTKSKPASAGPPAAAPPPEAPRQRSSSSASVTTAAAAGLMGYAFQLKSSHVTSCTDCDVLGSSPSLA